MHHRELFGMDIVCVRISWPIFGRPVRLWVRCRITSWPASWWLNVRNIMGRNFRTHCPYTLKGPLEIAEIAFRITFGLLSLLPNYHQRARGVPSLPIELGSVALPACRTSVLPAILAGSTAEWQQIQWKEISTGRKSTERR